jgi:hypothetical protein
VSLFAAEALAEGVCALMRDPVRAAVFCDIGGTLASVVDRADDAQAPGAVSRLRGAVGRRCACVVREVGEPAARGALGGNDVTGLDAFDALDALVADRRLGSAVRVGAGSAEGPRDIVICADLLADGVEGFARVIEGLLRAAR